MKSSQIILLIINAIIAILIGHFIGKKRHIGFWWSVLICLGTSVLLGVIITLFSPKLESSPHKPTKFKMITGIILIIFSLLGFLAYFEPNRNNNQNVDTFSSGFIFLTIGLYLYHLSKQESFPPRL